MECIQDTNPHPPCWLDLNWKVTVMCKEETQEDVLCCAVLILSPKHFNIELFVLQRNKCGGSATCKGEASASAGEKDPLLQDDVDWHTY